MFVIRAAVSEIQLFLTLNGKLEDSALFRTQTISPKSATYLQCLLFGWQKPFFSPVQSNIKPD